MPFALIIGTLINSQGSYVGTEPSQMDLEKQKCSFFITCIHRNHTRRRSRQYFNRELMGMCMSSSVSSARRAGSIAGKKIIGGRENTKREYLLE